MDRENDKGSDIVLRSFSGRAVYTLYFSAKPAWNKKGCRMYSYQIFDFERTEGSSFYIKIA